MHSEDVKPVSNNRDEIVWEESKPPPLEQLEDYIDDLSGKIEDYIEQEKYKFTAEVFYGVTARVFGSTIFINFDSLHVHFELKDLLAYALVQLDENHHDEDKQADIDDLLPLLRHYVTELENRQASIAKPAGAK